MKTKICSTCGDQFSVPDAREHTAKYCSSKCRDIGATAKANISCHVCGKQFHKKASHVSKVQFNYCSRECLGEHKKTLMAGSGNHQYGRRGADRGKAYKGGRMMSVYGYIKVLTSTGYELEHRHIMGLHLGRKLLPTEHVHHINGDRTDNRIENLQVVTKKDHSKTHKSSDIPIRKHDGTFYGRVITFNSESFPVSGWANKVGISCAAMIRRIEEWPIDLALTQPPGTRLSSAKIAHGDGSYGSSGNR